MRLQAMRSVVASDARSVARDNVALATIGLSLAGTGAITSLGLVADRPAAWSTAFPFVVAIGLVSGPSAFGFLFASLMVEERESGVRWALAVAPLPPRDLYLVRTWIATSWMCGWPLVSVLLMNATWGVLDVSLGEWLVIIVPLAFLTPGFALLIPTLAGDRISALAAFKVLSFASLVPLALFLVPPEAGYRWALLLSPTGFTVEAYRRLLTEGGPLTPWVLGSLAYAASLLSVVVYFFERNVYSSKL